MTVGVDDGEGIDDVSAEGGINVLHIKPGVLRLPGVCPAGEVTQSDEGLSCT